MKYRNKYLLCAVFRRRGRTEWRYDTFCNVPGFPNLRVAKKHTRRSLERFGYEVKSIKLFNPKAGQHGAVTSILETDHR